MITHLHTSVHTEEIRQPSAICKPQPLRFLKQKERTKSIPNVKSRRSRLWHGTGTWDHSMSDTSRQKKSAFYGGITQRTTSLEFLRCLPIRLWRHRPKETNASFGYAGHAGPSSCRYPPDQLFALFSAKTTPERAIFDDHMPLAVWPGVILVFSVWTTIWSFGKCALSALLSGENVRLPGKGMCLITEKRAWNWVVGR